MIGIIGAMNIEIDGLKAIMNDKCDKKIANITYTKGTVFGKDIVVAVCGEGKVNAAMCAQAMIDMFNPSMIINTGVGGGVKDGFNVCDVLSADSVVQHDMDMSPLGYEAGYICGIYGIEIRCDKTIADLLFDCITDCDIPCHRGVVATGDQFISSNEKKSWLVEKFNASVCEMEGGAIGQVCTLNNVPFGILRAISDSGDDEACMSFPEFAARAAENSIKALTLFLERV